MARQVDGIALGAIGAGSLLLYAGLTNRSIPAAVQAVISGKSPSSAAPGASLFAAPGAASSAPGGANVGAGANAFIAQTAMANRNYSYCFGGAVAGASGGCPLGEPDCSSWANWIIGKVAGLSIPGYPNGSYDGTVHGPATGDWLLWGGLTRISRASVSAGDLIISSSHMGIAISGSEYISAENPSLGIHVDAIPAGFFYYRLNQTLRGQH